LCPQMTFAHVRHSLGRPICRAVAAIGVGCAAIRQSQGQGLCCESAERKSSNKSSNRKAPLPAGVIPGPKSPSELIFDTLTRQRAIYLTGSIDDAGAKLIVAQLLVLEHQDPGAPITMYITSPGGKVYAGLAILDTMNFITSPVSTVVVGHASSMAAILAAGGEAGQRFVLPHARIMVHEPRKTAGRDLRAADLENSAAQLRHTQQLSVRLLAQFTGRSEAAIEALLDRDHYCSAEEAVELGLVDKVAHRISDIQRAGAENNATKVEAGSSVQLPTVGSS